MESVKVRRMKLGRQIGFIKKFDDLVKMDLIPEIALDVHTEADAGAFLRLKEVLAESPKFIEETIIREARIETLLIQNQIKLDQILEMLESVKERKEEE